MKQIKDRDRNKVWVRHGKGNQTFRDGKYYEG